MRVKTKVNARIFELTDEVDALFDPDDSRAEIISDNFTKENSSRFRIQPSASYVLNFGTITAVQGIYIYTIGPCNISINGSSPFSMSPPNSAVGTPAKFYFDGTVTAVTLTNPSSTSILDGRYVLWGDST